MILLFLRLTINLEGDGFVELNIGPPLRAVNPCPSSSKGRSLPFQRGVYDAAHIPLRRSEKR